MSEGISEAMRLGAALQGVVIEHGLRRIEAVTDTHIVTIQEPSIWGEAREHRDHPKVVIKEIDL